MTEATKISWADSTFNPWIGCTHVGPGCDHCYAEALMDHRMHKASWGQGRDRIRTSPENWQAPLKWDRAADFFGECAGCGHRGDTRTWGRDIMRSAATAKTCCPEKSVHRARRRVFCASLCDVFDNEVDPKWRDDLWTVIGATQNVDWLILTKRIGNAKTMLPWMPEYSGPDGQRTSNAWRNVWLGITVVNQAEADRDVPKLLDVPAHVRFLSVEPMLGPVRLTAFLACYGHVGPPCCVDKEGFHAAASRHETGIDWVICGGESGPHARPMELDWAQSLRDQCTAVGVPFLFKQAGGMGPDKGGDLLDGHTYKEWPTHNNTP